MLAEFIKLRADEKKLLTQVQTTTGESPVYAILTVFGYAGIMKEAALDLSERIMTDFLTAEAQHYQELYDLLLPLAEPLDPERMAYVTVVAEYYVSILRK
jgi:hypothetical protein